MPAELIRSRSNPVVRRFRAGKERGLRDGASVVFLEGPKLVEEALLSGVSVVEVAATPRAERSSRGRRLLRELAARGVEPRLVHEDVIESLSDAETSQGLVALAHPPRFDEAWLYRDAALVLVAVGVQSPGNLGALLRTGEAAGATGAYLTSGSADPFSWKALRGSMGSAFRLPLVRGIGLDEALRRLRARGVRVIATDATAPTRYDDTDLRRPIALLLGNEGSGLDEATLRRADQAVSIPLQGQVESLNVAVAAGVLLFEAARQRRVAQVST